MGRRYRRMENQKLWLGLVLKQDLVKGNGLKQKKMSSLGEVCE